MSSSMYAIFAYQTYYPAGGFHDIYGFADTFQEALAIFNEALETGSKPMKDWPTREIIKDYEQWTGKEIINPIPRAGAHIVNLKTQKIVADTRTIHNLNNE